MRVTDGQNRHDVLASTRLRIMHDQDLYSKRKIINSLNIYPFYENAYVG